MDFNGVEPTCYRSNFLKPVLANKLQFFHTLYYALHTSEAWFWNWAKILRLEPYCFLLELSEWQSKQLLSHQWQRNCRFMAATFIICWLPFQTVWNQIRTDRMTNLIWTQIIWYSDSVSERFFFFEKVNKAWLCPSMQRVTHFPALSQTLSD